MSKQKLIQLIHIAKQQLGIDDEIYRELLNDMFGVASSKQLTVSQCEALVKHFKSKGFKVKRKKQRQKLPEGVRKLPNARQIKLIEFLVSRYPWRYKNGFELWLSKQADKGHVSIDEEKRILDSYSANWVIEKLKQMTGVTTDEIEGRQA